MKNVGVIILAGGKSSRMGEDKGLMALFGKSMVAYVLDQAVKISEDIIIVSNNSNYKKYGYPTFKDLYKEKGPLAGLHTGLVKSKHHKNIVLSCDIPYVKIGLLNFLYNQSEGYDITIAQHEDRMHPLIGIYTKDCIQRFEECLKLDELKITKAFASLNFNIVPADEFDSIEFKNLNSKKDIIPFGD